MLRILTRSQSVFNWFYSVQSSGMRIFCKRYAWYFLMFINFYSVSAVSNLSSMLKCVLLLPSDCVYVPYCNEISSIINKIILQSRGRIVHCVVAKRPGGETSKGRNVQLPSETIPHTNLGGGIAGGKCDILILRCNSDIIRYTTFPSAFQSDIGYWLTSN